MHPRGKLAQLTILNMYQWMSVDGMRWRNFVSSTGHPQVVRELRFAITEPGPVAKSGPMVNPQLVSTTHTHTHTPRYILRAQLTLTTLPVGDAELFSRRSTRGGFQLPQHLFLSPQYTIAGLGFIDRSN